MNATRSPIWRLPSSTWCPPYQRIATSASVGQEVDERQEARRAAGPPSSAWSRTRVGLGGEALGLQALGAEALHDAHAGDALLDDARELAELLLELERRPGACGARSASPRC